MIRHALVITALSAMPALAQDGPTEPAYLYRAEVVNVVDGDTVDVDIDLGFYVWIKAQRIHLKGIAAPDASGSTKVAGDAAAEQLRTLIGGKEVIIRTFLGADDPGRTDSFGRWLGEIYLEGRDINREMVASGHAVSTP